MAIYEYTCPECQEEFQVMRPISEVEKEACCPACGKPGKRLMSVFASKADYSIKVPAKEAFRGAKAKAARKKKAGKAAAK